MDLFCPVFAKSKRLLQDFFRKCGVVGVPYQIFVQRILVLLDQHAQHRPFAFDKQCKNFFIIQAHAPEEFVIASFGK